MRAAVADVLRRVAHRIAPAPAPEVRVQINAEEIIRAIKRHNRRRGLPPGSLA